MLVFVIGLVTLLVTGFVSELELGLVSDLVSGAAYIIENEKCCSSSMKLSFFLLQFISTSQKLSVNLQREARRLGGRNNI